MRFTDDSCHTVADRLMSIRLRSQHTAFDMHVYIDETGNNKTVIQVQSFFCRDGRRRVTKTDSNDLIALCGKKAMIKTSVAAAENVCVKE